MGERLIGRRASFLAFDEVEESRPLPGAGEAAAAGHQCPTPAPTSTGLIGPTVSGACPAGARRTRNVSSA